MTLRRGRPGQGSDQGIAVILGAMMLTGILLSSYVVYQVSVVPNVETAKHVGHIREVSGQLGQLAASLEDRLDNRTGSTEIQPITLGRDGSGLLVTAPVSGSLVHRSDDLRAKLTIDKLNLQRVNGSDVAGATETWSTVTSENITGILRMISFRLKVDEVSSDHVGQSISVSVTDTHGEDAGSLTLTVKDKKGQESGSGKGYQVWVTTVDADGHALFDQPIHAVSSDEETQSGGLSPFWVDLLDAELRFVHVLASADEPYDVGLEPDGLDAAYAITYEKAGDGGGTRLVGAGGKEVTDLARGYTGGRLVYTTSAETLGRQELVLEHGAVILSQADGAVLKTAPPFHASVIDDHVSLDIGLPMLGSSGGALTGTGTGTVQTRPLSSSQIQGEANELSLNLTTRFPGVWERVWGDALDDAGLTQGTMYTVATGQSWANLTVYGEADPTPGSETYDISLHLRQATLGIRLDG